MNESTSLDKVFETALERIIDRKIDQLTSLGERLMISTRKARTLLDVEDRTFRKLVKANGWKPVQYVEGGGYYWKLADIKAFIEQRQKASAA